MPLEQETLARHMTCHGGGHALELQEIVKFLHKLELLVTCDGCKLLVETPGGQSGI